MTRTAMDFYGITAERAFADVWSRATLPPQGRRLLLLGLLVGQGLHEQVEVQLDAALRTGDLSEAELREVVVFLTHYAGWARGSLLNHQVEELIDRVRQDRCDKEDLSG